MSVLSDPAVVEYLATRLTSSNTGAAADELVAAAACGRDIDGTKPADFGDLSRCFVAFAEAPDCLQFRMLPQLIRWSDELNDLERGKREILSVEWGDYEAPS